jgi:hypothetical protein
MDEKILPEAKDKAELLEHVLHEVEMMALGLEVISATRGITEEERRRRMLELPGDGLRRVPLQFLHNAAMEEVLLHARSLYNFLFGYKAEKPDDLRASHFSYDKVPPASGEWPWRDRIDKEICHLTTHRSNVSAEKTWDLQEVTKLTREQIRPFLEEMHKQADYKGNRPRLEEAIKKLKDLDVGGVMHSGFSNLSTASSAAVSFACATLPLPKAVERESDSINK